MTKLSDYEQGTTNWRQNLKDNERKTRYVIFTFFAIYILVGLLVDVFIGLHLYGNVDAYQIFEALITLQITPFATLIMLALAAFSLFLTYALYDKIMLLGTNAFEVTHKSARSIEEQQLYHVVEEMKVAAGLRFMPKVFIIEADYMNAFASGYSERSAIVAITRGLLQKLNRSELQAVMAHELSHIRHHDIKLNLTVAVLSNIMLLVIDMLFYNLLFSSNRRDDNGRNGNQALFLAVIILRYVLPIITLLLTLFLSRTRELMADSGCVELMRDNGPLASALIKITYDHRENAAHYASEYGNTSHEQIRQASYIYDPRKIDPVKSLTSAFSTHPSLEARLKAIGYRKKV